MISLLAALALSTPVEAAVVVEPAPVVAPAPPRSRFEDGVLTLVMGERVTLRQGEDGAFSFVKAEAAEGDVTAEPGTVVFTLMNSAGTMLHVQSGLTKHFRYDAYFDARRRQRTSICTVIAGRMGMEMWGQTVRAFTLTNFRTVGDDQMVCE